MDEIQYAATVRGHGVRSILALPFLLDGDTRAARNIKLHVVAAGVVESLGQGPARTHFEG
ncbi:hypothetical protein [Arthrobacter sp. PsM3]|uniref:hypothetical protein n=1 Tax=Arthrobacter sp. PsM3 TaxID=3030531 RepID=UPI00263ACA32|nr:hypothetical protein [Arthrobacter sp. PsM3]MDN4644539.1 hypothetical protein [Arthrobacter sp. PsM3]